MIRITKLEAEYILETLETLELHSDDDEECERVLNSIEIIKSCLCNDAVDAYVLEEEDGSELPSERHTDT